MKRQMQRLLAATSVLAWAGLSAPTARASDAPPGAEQFFQRPSVMAPKLSPQGGRLAFMTPDADGRIRLAVVDLASEKVEPLGLNDADVIDFNWASETRLVYQAQDLRAAGLEGARLHRTFGVFSARPDGSEFRRLIHSEQERDDESGRVLGWNYTLLTVPQPQTGVETDAIVVGRARFAGSELAGVTPVRMNARTGVHREMELGNAPPDATSWWFDSAGRPRALAGQSDGQVRFFGRQAAEGDWQLLGSGSAMSLPFSIKGVDDAGHLYLSVADGPNRTSQLKLWDFAAKAPAAEPLLRVKGFDFEGDVLQNPGGSALGVRIQAEGEATVWFDPTMKRLQAELDNALPGHVNRIDCQRCGKPDMVLTVFSYADRDPGTLYLLDKASKQLKAIKCRERTSTPPAWPAWCCSASAHATGASCRSGSRCLPMRRPASPCPPW